MAGMRIIHVSAECYPIAKVGGLADVVGALPKYQNDMGHESLVILPHYHNDFSEGARLRKVHEATVTSGGSRMKYTIHEMPKAKLGFKALLVDIPRVGFTKDVYTSDDTERFTSFQITVLDWILTLKKQPDIVHCHDHHTGLIPFMMSNSRKYKSLKHIPTIFTIHNAQYQGLFSHDKVALIPAFDEKRTGLLDWNNLINPFAAAIKCAWRVTTVSPSYLEEMKVRANTVEQLIRSESAKCLGILNGIDTKLWDPETDPALVRNFASSSAQSGKKANKAWLCKEFNFDPDRPLVVFIGRLVHEKGADLFPELFAKIARDKKCSLLVLGSGNKALEKELSALVKPHQGYFNAYMGYDESLAHKMYAGADFLLMPSRVEPCGLNQMYSLRYGTVPIVSQVGGLRDTVIDIDKKGFGIQLKSLAVTDIKRGVDRALKFYQNQQAFRANRKKIMALDHSWDESARQYVNLYKSTL